MSVYGDAEQEVVSHPYQCVTAARDPLSSRRPCERRRLEKEWGGLEKEWGSGKRVKKWEKNAFCGKRVNFDGKRKISHASGALALASQALHSNECSMTASRS